MDLSTSIILSLAICILAAGLEGIAAGNNIKPFFSKLRMPWYAPPLSVWIVIGVAYYVICFFILYRIFRHSGDDGLRYTSLALLSLAMVINAVFNYTFFRLENLFYSLLMFVPYLPAVIALFFCLLRFDQAAAFALVPYFIYLVYVTLLSYKLWILNPEFRGG